MEPFTIRHDDELERAYGKWVLVRRSLGIESFGLNAVELPPGESIPEHDETGRGHEEVFLVLEGEPTIVVDGVDHPLAAGLVRPARAEPKRTVRNDGTSVARVLIVSAPVGERLRADGVGSAGLCSPTSLLLTSHWHSVAAASRSRRCSDISIRGRSAVFSVRSSE